MNLHGWDVWSIVSIPLVNAALARDAADLPPFSYSENGLLIEGRFRSWSIAPGGSAALLNMEMEIETGQIAEDGFDPVPLAGAIVSAQMALRLVPKPDGSGSELRFEAGDRDTGSKPGSEPGSEAAARAVQVHGISDPSGKLAAMDQAMVVEALSACLSAHAALVSFVFASVEARGTSGDDWLKCPHHGWGYVETGDGRAYLALTASRSGKPAAAPFRIDPAMLTHAGSAYFVVSWDLFAERVLKPTLEKEFRPKTRFSRRFSRVQNAHPIRLPGQHHGPVWVEPIMDLAVAPLSGGLSVVAKAKADLPLRTKLNVIVTMRLPFVTDSKRQTMGFRSDPRPKVKTDVSKKGIIGHTLGLFVELFVTIVRKPVEASILRLAQRMQKFSNPTVQPVRWNGLRDFKFAHSRWDQGLWLVDTRPAPTPEQADKDAQRATKTAEKA